ncbi:hypothetical protein BT67DRAFT_74620 [Trichocladium antarcticum]|uniref:Uncharacterized protein n=1 Tax=Trichocladium antarcticum TaxID=1450529 RepID=A0AAN6UGY2_9PEZI|nr:hypothetical protein BT67DRAFT_74620 [Trichocladium antarcticum]
MGCCGLCHGEMDGRDISGAFLLLFYFILWPRVGGLGAFIGSHVMFGRTGCIIHGTDGNGKIRGVFRSRLVGPGKGERPACEHAGEYRKGEVDLRVATYSSVQFSSLPDLEFPLTRSIRGSFGATGRRTSGGPPRQPNDNLTRRRTSFLFCLYVYHRLRGYMALHGMEFCVTAVI